MPAGCSSRPPARDAEAAALKAAVVRAVARMEGGAIAMDAATTQALQKLLADPATSAAVLPIVAKWDKAGDADARAPKAAPAPCWAISATPRRATTAAPTSPPACSPSRSGVQEALATIAPMLTDSRVPEPLKGRLIATLGESAGQRCGRA